MPSRRKKSLHHNLGDKNVIFHSEHRSKRGRLYDRGNVHSKMKRDRLQAIKNKELERDGIL